MRKRSERLKAIEEVFEKTQELIKEAEKIYEGFQGAVDLLHCAMDHSPATFTHFASVAEQSRSDFDYHSSQIDSYQATIFGVQKMMVEFQTLLNILREIIAEIRAKPRATRSKLVWLEENLATYRDENEQLRSLLDHTLSIGKKCLLSVSKTDWFQNKYQKDMMKRIIEKKTGSTIHNS